MERRKHAAQSAAGPTAFSRLITCFLLLLVFGCTPRYENSQLPRPVIPEYPDLEELYYKSWALLSSHQYHGTKANGFSDTYLNSYPDEMLEQWPSLTMALFGIYADNCFPVMKTLDIFYKKQERNGFISRAYLTSSGKSFRPNTTREPMVHPPMFSWIELKHYYLTGDKKRLMRVLPVLEKYFIWLDKNCRGKDEASDLYFHTELSSCMENAPRGNLGYGAWVDMSGQMAAFCRDLVTISKILDDKRRLQYFTEKYKLLDKRITRKLWNDEAGMYADMTRDGALKDTKLLAGYWPLFAGISTHETTEIMIGHLQDSSLFYQPNLFPSLAKSDPSFSVNGFYWRGSVWSPMNYMIMTILKQNGREDFAHEAAINHLASVAKTYLRADSIKAECIPEGLNRNVNRMWECYSPERQMPATRWDNQYYVRPDAVEFTGIGPVAMLIEDVIGMNINLAEAKIDWRIRGKNNLGIQGLVLGKHHLSLWCEQEEKSGQMKVHGYCDIPLTISFRLDDEDFVIQTEPGPIEFYRMPENFIMTGRTID